MDNLRQKYELLCRNDSNISSDIYEHLPTLSEYASKCESIIELGVRGVVSTYAFLNGLMNNNSPNKKLLMNDIDPCNIDEVLQFSEKLNINTSYCWINDLNMEVNENYDMTFIDTLHVYGQLKRELEKYSKITNKYIIMHDTTIDGEVGELYRSGYTNNELINFANKISIKTGIPANELLIGLVPAINEFLRNNTNWVLERVYTNNNGLTILKRIQ